MGKGKRAAKATGTRPSHGVTAAVPPVPAAAVTEAPAAAAVLVGGVRREAVLVALALAGAVVLALVQLAARAFPVWTDENVHVYVARRVSEGAVLYRDIDSARPPLVIWALSGLMTLGLPPLVAARGLVALLVLATASGMFLGGRRLFGTRAAVLAVLLLLLSPEIVQRAPYTGIQLVSLGVLGCLLLALLGWPLASGAVFGLALASGQHALIAGLCAGLAVVARRPRDGLRFAGGFLASFAAVFGLARLLGADRLWENLVARHLYHLGGNETAGRLGAQLGPWLGENLPVFALMLGALALELRGRRRRPVQLLALAVALQFVALAVMSQAKFLYLVPVFPLICLLAGVGADALVSRLPGARVVPLGLAALGALLAVTAGGWRWAQSRREAVDSRAYSFLPHRRSLQMARVQRLHVAEAIARDLAGALPEDASIFGQPSVTSAVATAGARRIAGELADLDERWIAEGRLSWAEVVQRIEGGGVQAVITPRWTLVRDPTFAGYLGRCYQAPRVYPRAARGSEGDGLPDVLVFARRALPRPCS